MFREGDEVRLLRPCDGFSLDITYTVLVSIGVYCLLRNDAGVVAHVSLDLLVKEQPVETGFAGWMRTLDRREKECR